MNLDKRRRLCCLAGSLDASLSVSIQLFQSSQKTIDTVLAFHCAKGVQQGQFCNQCCFMISLHHQVYSEEEAVVPESHLEKLGENLLANLPRDGAILNQLDHFC